MRNPGVWALFVTLAGMALLCLMDAAVEPLIVGAARVLHQPPVVVTPAGVNLGRRPAEPATSVAFAVLKRCTAQDRGDRVRLARYHRGEWPPHA